MGPPKQPSHPFLAKTLLQLSLNSHNFAAVKESTAIDNCPQPLCPLSRVSPGTAVRIKQVSGSPEITNRLREMGFCEEQCIKLISRHHNFLCQVCHARIGISLQIADNILVEPLPARKVA